LKWKFQAAGAISASPVVGADSAIYFGSWDHAFYGLNPDGTLKWQLYMPEDVRCTPALAPDGTLYFGHYGKLRAEGMEILVDNDPAMRRPYVVMEVNPERFPDANAEGARRLADFLLSPKVQDHLATSPENQRGGIPLFHPVARP